MPINNLNNAHLTEAQMNEIKTALVSCFEKVVHFVYSAALLMAQL